MGFSHPVDDEGDEEDVGEGGVDAPVERNPPLLAEPGGVVDTCPVCWPDPWCKCQEVNETCQANQQILPHGNTEKILGQIFKNICFPERRRTMDCDKRKPPWRVETRVEKWVEEEKEVARDLFANVQKPGMEIYCFL